MHNEVIDLRNRSRKYKAQKEKLINYKENRPYLFDPRCLVQMGVNLDAYAKTKMEYDFVHFEIALLSENIRSVERDFELLEKACGPYAAEMIRRNFIDGENWEEIAEDSNISRRTLSRMQNIWYTKFHDALHQFHA